ncbi:prepilin-type N-terminal cleavage/methylation domain-containing protein [Brevundimonas sp. NIBR11]|uniref:type II secretion system protein n=1 Tax=Brevundimonas sp. NIBR11 TaxID=3015999 RepID=UPI0022F09364|nr:prepilin-type N-terminal cleavage/methylation domain-containing protein [Brevundimonas sp. NIBR11]WGM32274.1 hypothetical protein KKHFBJBL_02525 [Brevundimonas sp. NIBR11]
MVPKGFHSGFSLIEALVVLAIGGMALAIIFSIGVKAGDTGFGLGRRAMTVADADIATSDLRSILRSVVLRPANTFVVGVDRPVLGSRDELDTEVVMERSTQCAPQGWAGRMVLRIEPRDGKVLLTCTAGGKTRTLIDFADNPAAFSYSVDGQTWTPTYTNAPIDGVRDEVLRSQSLWIRLAGPPIADVVEHAASGRPLVWVRPDA